MTKAAFIRARIEPDLKLLAESVLNELGVTPTQVITMLYKQIAREQEVPLSLRLPNALTRKTMDETDQNIGLIECKNIDDLFGKLGLNDDVDDSL
jgi:DNA-damage-inducible protein J